MSPDRPKPSPLQERTTSRRALLKDLLTVGSGSTLAFSFYKSGQILKEIESTQKAIESNEYWSDRTPGAQPKETDRLKQTESQLTEKFVIGLSAAVISGTFFIADLRDRSKDSTPKEIRHTTELEPQS